LSVGKNAGMVDSISLREGEKECLGERLHYSGEKKGGGGVWNKKKRPLWAEEKPASNATFNKEKS